MLANFKDRNIEELIKKTFPDYDFYWTGEKSKPILDRHKGSEIAQAMLKKTTFNAFAIRVKTNPGETKFILWESTWTGTLFYFILLITGIIPLLIVLIILKSTSFKFKGRGLRS